MKTIFDKMDNKYLEHVTQGTECSAGACDHLGQSGNGFLWTIVVFLTVVVIKTWKTRAQ